MQEIFELAPAKSFQLETKELGVEVPTHTQGPMILVPIASSTRTVGGRVHYIRSLFCHISSLPNLQLLF